MRPPSGPLDLEALAGRNFGPVDLRVEPGRPAAILGPSGAGKSLLLRRIVDLDPGTGDVRLGALRCSATPPTHWRRLVVLVPAEPGWWAPGVAAHFPSGSAACDLRRLGLSSNIMSRAAATLSTGERQRLALLRALALRPAALLLDEPTAALDPISVGAVEELLRDALAAGLVLLVVTHDAAVATRLGARSYTMSAGRLSPA